jgi:hypothetical protein
MVAGVEAHVARVQLLEAVLIAGEIVLLGHGAGCVDDLCAPIAAALALLRLLHDRRAPRRVDAVLWGKNVGAWCILGPLGVGHDVL